MNILEIGLASVAVMVIFGAPIWFSVKARPLGPLPYRWGTFVGSCAILASIALLRTAVADMRDYGSPVLAVLTAMHIAGTIGVLRRRRCGAASLLLSQAAIIVLNAFSLDSDGNPQNPMTFAPLLGVAINGWYFGRRWRLMDRHWQHATAAQADEETEAEVHSLDTGQSGDS